MEVRFPIEKLVSCQTATIMPQPQEAENVITGLAVCCWDTELGLWGRSFLRRLINLTISVAKSYFYIFTSQNQLEKIKTCGLFFCQATMLSLRLPEHQLRSPNISLFTDASGMLGFGAVYWDHSGSMAAGMGSGEDNQ